MMADDTITTRTVTNKQTTNSPAFAVRTRPICAIPCVIRSNRSSEHTYMYVSEWVSGCMRVCVCV